MFSLAGSITPMLRTRCNREIVGVRVSIGSRSSGFCESIVLLRTKEPSAVEQADVVSVGIVSAVQTRTTVVFASAR